MRDQARQPKIKAVPKRKSLLGQSSKIVTTVLLADDSELMRTAILRLLRDIPDIRVLDQASGFVQTIELAAKLHPHVILADVHMRDEDLVTRQYVKSCLSGSRVIAMSIWTDNETKSFAEEIGAVALLDKAELGLTLTTAIRDFQGHQEFCMAHA
jgi:DNA-binding NarL/FixJ family response regulator